MVEKLLFEINFIKKRIINKQIKNLEEDLSFFYKYLINYISQEIKNLPGLDYNLIKIYNEIKTEIESERDRETYLISKDTIILNSKAHKADILNEIKEPITKPKKKLSLFKKKKSNKNTNCDEELVKDSSKKIEIMVTEVQDAIVSDFKMLNTYENCWYKSYLYLTQRNQPFTLIIKRSLSLKLLFAHVLTYFDFINAGSDESFLKCLNKFQKIFYCSSLKQLLKCNYLKKEIKNNLRDYEYYNENFFFEYDQYGNSEELVLWYLYDSASDVEFEYMTKY
ncbi:hypothetical protein CPAV1605_867 [seawater metagenome]|uniref:Uncharacterized protein n=1 Tax=seawater metagenome TaxID=1561972 RepID=A0A5E8CLY8_9ZZZZ